ncbi:type I-E CRISPR-associated protein Cse1/CasA [Streptomyces sp. NPDC097619]|uniref:type I-E CRISPR-associated protein Cse1/CasA n=1 Tax=Streptomyces sp. NPDC097619 TaxID=3157228 RepID=UPI0033192F78
MSSGPIPPGNQDGIEKLLGRLSSEARTAWAKHDRKSDSFMPLWRHMADSHAVAGMLWEHWVPLSARRLVAEVLPGGAEDAALLVGFLAAVHDCGKSTGPFACQVPELADRMRDLGLEMPTRKEYGSDRRMAPHGLAGQLLLQEWLKERYGFDARSAGQFAVVVGGHHGTPPDSQQIHDLQLRPRLLRTEGPSAPLWRQVQHELIDGCAELAAVTDRLPHWVGVRLSQPAQVVLTGVVIMADWLASASELFPYAPESWLPTGPSSERRRLRAAWAGVDLPNRWEPRKPEGSPEEFFAERFPTLVHSGIRPVQAEAVRMARGLPEGGLLMIEAPMGEGKTEAALAAAEVLAAGTGAGGILFALPTRATADAMFPRLLDWLDQVLDPSLDGSHSVTLAHAKAALNDTWSGFLAEGRRVLAAVDTDCGEDCEDIRSTQTPGPRTVRNPTGLHAHQWLRGRKKQLLSSFAVGTVDQVLFAALKTRHLALRHLALVGKVVVIDEVHAYDAYMSRYLERVLEWLAAYRVPVVLLSATLPADRREALAAAYAGISPDAVRGLVKNAAAYPLITAAAPDGAIRTAQPEAASGRNTSVIVERLDDDLELLADRLERELADGGCALVIRNTVARVVEAAELLRARFGDEHVTVTHSRFLAADRAANDADLLDRFGPVGTRRPGRHIVVASQVVESSLDVSFDLMVTDLAPVDLMLQRMGRLHRHPRPLPHRLRQARCLVTGTDWQAAPPTPVSGTSAVYPGRFTLLRALAVLVPHLDGRPLRLPTDISPLVQAAYGSDPVGPDDWAEAFAAAQVEHNNLTRMKEEKAEDFLLGPVRRPGRPLYGWLEADAGDSDDSPAGRAQVRDSEETIEVLVVQRQADGTLTTVPWLTDGPPDRHGDRRPRARLPLSEDFPPGRWAAEAVAASALTLPRMFSTPWMADRTIADLERFLVPAWQVKECPWLAGELFLVLDPDCQTRLAGFDLYYSKADGLRVASPGMPAPWARRRADAAPEDRGRENENGEDGKGEALTGPAHSGGSEEGAGHPAITDHGHVRDDGPHSGTATVTARPAEPVADPILPAAQQEPSSFDLVSRPWIPVQRHDGTATEVSLRGLFAEAATLRRTVGDVPTQDFALLRLLLAILYDALDGPREMEDWEDLWNSPTPFDAVEQYLAEHRPAFDLLHPERPFYQVAGLRTAKDEVFPLGRIVADVPTGSPFFTMRLRGAENLSYAEAARWLVHAHAYDTSGIKSAMVGDEGRAKAGKVYPLGVGSVGGLGGVCAEGDNLRDTLLLNLIPFEEAYTDAARRGADLPVWRRTPLGAGPRDAGPLPDGLRDLYTWQSRRIRLHARDGVVTGVVLGYGDPLVLPSPHTLEPMSAWRRSAALEKKQGRAPVYGSSRHDPSRAAWRGLGALLPSRAQPGEQGGKAEPPNRIRSGVSRWFTQVVTETEFRPDRLVRLRLTGVSYGTQQSVIDEVMDDAVVLPVITLHAGNPEYGAVAVDAVSDAELAVSALGHLAGHLARATGSESTGPADEARDLGFGALDGPYRSWLRGLLEHEGTEAARQAWRDTVRRTVLRLGRQLIVSAGPAAIEGRTVELPGLGVVLMDAGRAEQWFLARLEKVLGPVAAVGTGRGNG